MCHSRLRILARAQDPYFTHSPTIFFLLSVFSSRERGKARQNHLHHNGLPSPLVLIFRLPFLVFLLSLFLIGIPTICLFSFLFLFPTSLCTIPYLLLLYFIPLFFFYLTYQMSVCVSYKF
ncbi:hypothetical protein VTN00DRAFT_5380 [Thermoascus crustaceus]|uniref:uncharacterized protein n=1 Tax=Thermoascus crustaceus TaxID=5088 RepID=UPI0037428F79